MMWRAGSWLALTCALSWPLLWLSQAAGHAIEGPWLLAVSMPYILAPALSTALWRRFIVRESGGEVPGQQVRFNHALLGAWVGPVVLLWGAVLIAHGMGWATLDLSGQGIVDRVAAGRGAEAAAEVSAELAAATLPYPVMACFQALIVGVLFSPIWFAEEIGWRGVMLTELRPLGFWNAALLSGLFWGIWRVPLLLSGEFLPGDPMSAGLLIVAGSVPLGACLAWLRVRGGTLWAPAIALSVLTMVGPFDELALKGGTPMSTSPLGAAGGLMALFAALLLFALTPRGPSPELADASPVPG